MEERRLPYRLAFFWILMVTLLISGSAWLSWFYYLHLLEKRVDDPGYEILSVVQGSLNRNLFKTEQLLQLLNLSEGEMSNLYRFNSEEGVKKLLTSPLLKSASIKKKFPNSLYILYEMRDPVAYLGDFSNTVVDQEGYLFPFHPFYTPKKLPTVYFGLKDKEIPWGSTLSSDPLFISMQEILRNYEALSWKEFFLQDLDLSSMLPVNSAAQDFTLTLREKKEDWFDTGIQKEFVLKLNPYLIQEGLELFSTIYQKILKNKQGEERQIHIDLRLLDLAFIENQK